MPGGDRTDMNRQPAGLVLAGCEQLGWGQA